MYLTPVHRPPVLTDHPLWRNGWSLVTGFTQGLSNTIINACICNIFQVRWIHQSLSMVISSDDTIDLEPVFNPIIDGNYKYMVVRTVLGDRFVNTIQKLQCSGRVINECKPLIK